ncbi:Lin1244/Lin1753 domain-containing protein [Hathewaya massiliensis]|uniref:Lin1244/Lin1753 domain-containing protein n=1 Tax=Hathewaya massiliensis TaxID=1964382 RepID=UPI0011583186|nr:Lin1244/Lin1753 domain-containing protein [Hathewaya massiliensis]
MARPRKEGLDYFPLDVYLDDKFKFIEIKFKLEGFAIVIKLLQKIYANGYYIGWSEDEELLFTDEIRAELTTVKDVVEECLIRDIFSREMYEKYKVLTSKGIQKRFIEATKKRAARKIKKELDLVSEEITEVSEEKTEVKEEKTPVNSTESTQSKVKNSKVKNSKVNNNINESDENIVDKKYVDFFNNNFHLITKFELDTLNSFIEDGLSEEVIVLALEKAVENGVRTINYVKAILQSWLENNIKTVDDVKAFDEAFKRSQIEKGSKGKTVVHKKQNEFCDYEQRKYDFESLERKLLGWDKEGEEDNEA